MTNNEICEMYTAIALILLALLGFVGWVLNIIAITYSPTVTQWGAMEVLRCIGVLVPPLGAVLGFF